MKIREDEKIRILTIQALFMDDELYDVFVLKGGNALKLAFKLEDRTSKDIDVSMASDFKEVDLSLSDVEEKLISALQKVFRPHEYEPFDFKIVERPKIMNPDKGSFWGGYSAEFKVIDSATFKKLGIEEARKRAIGLGDGQKKSIQIDISKHEYCAGKMPLDLDGIQVFAYTPLMFINEKLRAICQQMPEYNKIVATSSSPRPRDFFDIHLVFENLGIDEALFLDKDNIDLLKEIFKIKRVPLAFLGLIKSTFEFHEKDYGRLQASISGGFELKDFSFYFEYVTALVEKLEPFWKE